MKNLIFVILLLTFSIYSNASKPSQWTFFEHSIVGSFHHEVENCFRSDEHEERMDCLNIISKNYRTIKLRINFTKIQKVIKAYTNLTANLENDRKVVVLDNYLSISPTIIDFEFPLYINPYEVKESLRIKKDLLYQIEITLDSRTKKIIRKFNLSDFFKEGLEEGPLRNGFYEITLLETEL